MQNQNKHKDSNFLGKLKDVWDLYLSPAKPDVSEARREQEKINEPSAESEESSVNKKNSANSRPKIFKIIDKGKTLYLGEFDQAESVKEPQSQKKLNTQPQQPVASSSSPKFADSSQIRLADIKSYFTELPKKSLAEQNNKQNSSSEKIFIFKLICQKCKLNGTIRTYKETHPCPKCDGMMVLKEVRFNENITDSQRISKTIEWILQEQNSSSLTVQKAARQILILLKQSPDPQTRQAVKSFISHYNNAQNQSLISAATQQISKANNSNASKQKISPREVARAPKPQHLKLKCPLCHTVYHSDTRHLGVVIFCKNCCQEHTVWLPEEHLPKYPNSINSIPVSFLVRIGLLMAFKSPRFTSEQIELLKSTNHCMRLFNMHMPVMRNISNCNDSRYSQNFFTFNGTKYFICLDWGEQHRKYLIHWLRQMGVTYNELAEKYNKYSIG